MSNIVAKGRNLQEAIDIGLELLGISRENAMIEILEREKKGFLKIGSRPALVRITDMNHATNTLNTNDGKDISTTVGAIESIPTTNQSNDGLESINNNRDIKEPTTPIDDRLGKAWVENGKVRVNSSASQYPTIQPGKNSTLLVNQKQIYETTVVTEDDQVEIKLTNVEKQTESHLSIDTNKLEVILKIKPGYQINRFVKNSSPSEHLLINVEEEVVPINHLNYQDIIMELSKLNVRHGFHHPNIMRASETLEEGEFIIASGVPPQKGKDGWLELLIELDHQSDQPLKRADGTVDYREINSLPSVKKGQVIAVVHPPIPGVPGVTVTNDPIPPEQTFPIILSEGKGIALIDNGSKVVATEAGRPSLKRRGMFVKAAIMPKLVRDGNVDLKSGNIRFKGDVDILGNVDDGMVVEADGDVYIANNVTKATITTNNAIVIANNIIGGNISAGKNNMLIVELGQKLGRINEDVKRVIGSIEQLIQATAFKVTDLHRQGLYPLIKLLLEKKFQSLAEEIKQFCATAKKGGEFLEEEWTELADKIHLCFLSPMASEYSKLEHLRLLHAEMEKLYEYSQQEVSPNAYVTAMYALNSTIYSSGNITFFGQGCYNCKIHASGLLQINGILRGGNVYGQLGVEVKEIGSETGVITNVRVPYDKVIKADKVMEGTVFQIGRSKYTFIQTQNNVIAKLGQNGEIVFESKGEANVYV